MEKKQTSNDQQELFPRLNMQYVNDVASCPLHPSSPCFVVSWGFAWGAEPDPCEMSATLCWTLHLASAQAMLRLGTGHNAVTSPHKPQASNMQHCIMSTYQHMHHPVGFLVSKGVSTERQRQPRHNVERLKTAMTHFTTLKPISWIAVHDVSGQPVQLTSSTTLSRLRTVTTHCTTHCYLCLRPAAGGAALVSDLNPRQRSSHSTPAVLPDSCACA